MGLQWSNEGLHLNLRIQPAGLILAVVYAVACWGARKISLDQFYLPAGVRVAALLICPPRLWPYLLLGEYAYFAQMRVPMIGKYGWLWVVLGSAFLMPAVALIVRLHRRMMAGTTDIWLVSVAIASAAAATTINITASHLLWPIPPSIPPLSGAARMFLGDFIAILTVGLPALLWTRRRSEPEWSRRFMVPTLGAIALTLLLGLSATVMAPETAGAKASVLLLMALPAIALTCMHGWRGAAIGVPLLNLIIHMTTPSSGHPESFDAETFATQQSMAVLSIALLALGSSISYYRQQYRARALAEEAARALARTSQISTEMHLKERALHLREIGDGIDASLSQVMTWLQSHGHHDTATELLRASAKHARQFREQTSLLYPTSLEQLGLYLTMQTGGLRQAWEETHRVTRPRLAGNPCHLSVELQLAAYRTLSDAVSLLLGQETGQLSIQTRCGRVREQRGIVMVVALLDRGRALSWATTDLAREQLTARVLAHGGRVHCRHNRIRILLRETALPVPQRSETLLRTGCA